MENMTKYLLFAVLSLGAWLMAEDAPKPIPKPATVEQLQKQVADLQAQLAAQTETVRMLDASAKTWLQQYNGCVGQVIQLTADLAKAGSKKTP